jgi:hypothetical protein
MENTMGLFGQEPDDKTPFLLVIITFALAGVTDGRAELFHEPYVLIGAAFRHADLAGQFRRGSGPLDADQVIDPVESLEDFFLHGLRL